MTQTQYPVLTYGTLRPGCGNYEWCLKGETIHEETVELEGLQMRGNSGFPYVLEVEGAKIVATLNYIAPDRYDSVLASMDSLEGYRADAHNHNHYDRILFDFESNGTKRQAYIYVARSRFAREMAEALPVIEDGDWIEHMRKDRPHYAVRAF
jgi:gamma-glutamylcyclotransferase (GGCT)/AIG2-like uncharacterized protein YtfP